MYKIKYFIVIGVIVSWVLAACQNPVEHTAPAIHARDSVAMMTSYGVNTLISDSGVIKYRIVTERWEVNTNRVPSRWILIRVCCSNSLTRSSTSTVISSAIRLITLIRNEFGSFMAVCASSLRMVFALPASSSPGMRTSTNSPAMCSVSWLLRSVPFRVPISGAMSV